jgi:hypothetical protein
VRKFTKRNSQSAFRFFALLMGSVLWCYNFASPSWYIIVVIWIRDNLSLRVLGRYMYHGLPSDRNICSVIVVSSSRVHSKKVHSLFNHLVASCLKLSEVCFPFFIICKKEKMIYFSLHQLTCVYLLICKKRRYFSWIYICTLCIVFLH